MACIYGDIDQIDTTGASRETANQDHLKMTGVTASHKLAECDLKRMNEYKHLIVEVAQYCEMDPAVICGIISRESRAGATLDNGWGDHGNAFGLMQVDRRYHQPVGAWDSKEHIRQATDILVYFINAIKKKFPRWPKEHHFKGGIAAYNAGDGSVNSYEGVDARTTGGDYSNDVVARAQWFRTKGF